MSILMPATHAEWIEARKTGLGASDAGTIIGANRWKTNLDLFREKTGLKEAEDISEKPHVKLGHDAEPLIRALFAMENPQYEVEYESPFKMIFNDEHSFIFCTPDGELVERFTRRKGILEIKTTEIRNPAQWKEWDGRIPDTYYAQICHQLLATGWDFAILKVRIRYHKDGELRIAERQYNIEREEAKEDIEYLLAAEIDFWDHIQSETLPDLKLPSI